MSSDLIPHLHSLTEISRANSSDQRRKAALYAAEVAQDGELALFLQALGLAELRADGRLYASVDMDGGRWFDPAD